MVAPTSNRVFRGTGIVVQRSKNSGTKMRCRICWEEEESPGKLQAPSTDNHLISPCRCKGTVRWVHVTCLRHWRAAHSPSDDSFKKCLLCGANYRMKWRPLARIVASPHALQGIALMVTFIALLASCTVAVKFSGLWLPLLHYKALGCFSLTRTPEHFYPKHRLCLWPQHH